MSEGIFFSDQIVLRSHLWSLYLKMLVRGLILMLYCSPVILLSVVSTFFEKLVNNRIVDYLEKFGLFSDFQ